jgi:hypothetical protein
MGSYVLSGIIICVIGLIVIRTGKRRSRHALQYLARHCGGVYMHGGLFSPSFVSLARGAAQIRVEIRPLSRLGSRAEARFVGPWAGRPAIGPIAPQVFCYPEGSGDPTTLPKNSLARTAGEFNSLANHSNTSLDSNRGRFEIRTELKSLSDQTVFQWLQLATRFYELMRAETEPGVHFETRASKETRTTASCQVCGTAPSPEDTVTCDRCGAPHHAECWNYNGGCAIFGCRH